MKWAVLGAHDGYDTLIRDDGALFAVLASHAAEQLTVKPALPSGGELTSLGGEKTAEGVELGPFGITILTDQGSGASQATADVTASKVATWRPVRVSRSGKRRVSACTLDWPGSAAARTPETALADRGRVLPPRNAQEI